MPNKSKKAQPKLNPQQNQPKKVVPYDKGKSLDEALNRYKLALTDPFHPDAIGAQVPDMYSYPTATYHAEGTVTIASNAGSIANLLLNWHPFASMVDMTGASVNSTGMSAYTNSTTTYAAVSQANLAAVLTNWRLVGAGFQIRNLQPPTTATGRLIAASIPTVGDMPGPANLSANIIPNRYVASLITGIDTGAVNTGFASDILELPEADEITLQDIINEVFEIHLKPLSPDAFNFHSAQNYVATNTTQDLVGGAAFTVGTGVIASGSADNANLTECAGWDCVLINANGLPASTNNCFEIKYIYHFEGTPSLPSTQGTLVPGSNITKHVNPIGHMAVLQQALNSPGFKLCSKAVGMASEAYFGKVPGALASLMMSKLGLTI